MPDTAHHIPPRGNRYTTLPPLAGRREDLRRGTRAGRSTGIYTGAARGVAVGFAGPAARHYS